MDEVDVDEKWFFLCQEGARYILVNDEKNPYRSVKHKSHIEKVADVVSKLVHWSRVPWRDMDSDSADEEWDDSNAHVAETVAAAGDLNE